MFIPCARISVSNRSIVSFGPKRLGIVVNPSALTNELDAGINQPREEIAIDHEPAPFRIVVCRRFGSDHFVARFALLFQAFNLFASGDQHIAEFDQLRFVADWTMARDNDRLVASSGYVCFRGPNHSVNAATS